MVEGAVRGGVGVRVVGGDGRRVARALLSGGDATSDDVVASELFDLLGDAGVELVMGVVERRAAMTAAFRRRLTTLRDRLGGGDDGEVSKKFGGGSGAPPARR